jgi:hypothetical protein
MVVSSADQGESSFEDLLARCGVTPLTARPEENGSLDRDGFVVLPRILGGAELESLRKTFENACADAGTGAGGTGTRHAEGFLVPDASLVRLVTEPRILAAVFHVLRQPFVLRQLSFRDPQPRFGAQGLHADWPSRPRGEEFFAATAIVMLNAFTPENGATRVVPGSHRLPGMVPKSYAEPASRHPGQQIVTGTAGSVLVFNGHLWHGGTTNATNGSRRAIQMIFVLRGLARLGPPAHPAPQTLPPDARAILGA